jgi:hypothetical protein
MLEAGFPTGSAKSAAEAQQSEMLFDDESTVGFVEPGPGVLKAESRGFVHATTGKQAKKLAGESHAATWRTQI